MLYASILPSNKSNEVYRRKLRNYILNPRFQLKYTGYLIFSSLFLSVALGSLLWRANESMVSLGHTAVSQSIVTVKNGQELIKESQKISLMTKMTIDKAYADQPELMDLFGGEEQIRAAKLLAEQQRLEDQTKKLKEQAEALKKSQRTTLGMLVVGLVTFVIFIGISGVVITHKVAGPIFKMKRQIEDLGQGILKRPGRLRKGDELVDFFVAFDTMIEKLRARRASEIDKLNEIICKIETTSGQDAVSSVKMLRDEIMKMMDLKNTTFRNLNARHIVFFEIDSSHVKSDSTYPIVLFHSFPKNIYRSPQVQAFSKIERRESRLE